MCSDCRQRQAQHRLPKHNLQIASVSILDVLRQVPTLPESLTPDAQKAMSATCKSCHARFVAQVEVVTIVRQEDYALVLKRRWPRLRMVLLQDKNTFCSVSHPSKIFHVYVQNEGNKRTTVTLLRPLQGLATDLPWTRLAAQQLTHQLQLRWPSMSIFMMSFVHDLGDLASCHTACQDHLDRLGAAVPL